MVKLNYLKKLGLTAFMACAALGAAQAQDELVGTYVWSIQIDNSSSVLNYTAGDNSTMTVEVYQKDATNYYIAETGSTNYFKGQTVPFTLNSNTNACAFSQQTGLSIDGKSLTFGIAVYNNGNFSDGNITGSKYNNFSFKQETGFSFTGANPVFVFFDGSYNLAGGIQFISSSDAIVDDPTVYEMTIQPILNVFGSLGTPTTIRVKIEKTESEDENSASTVVLTEQEPTNFFHGIPMQFSLTSGDEKIFIEQPAEPLDIDGENGWYSAFVKTSEDATFIEVQAEYAIDYNEETGIAVTPNVGFAFFQGDTPGLPNGFISGFYFAGEGNYEGVSLSQTGNYPDYEVLDGQHTFKGTLTMTEGYDADTYNAAGFKLLEELTVTLEGNDDAGVPSFDVSGFISKDSFYMTYNQVSDGTLVPNSANMGDYVVGTTIGEQTFYQLLLTDPAGNINPNYKPATAQWQVTEAGNIIVPDFAIVQRNTGTGESVIIAKYTDCTIDGYIAPTITLSNLQTDVNVDVVTVTFDVATENLEADEVASWRLQVTEYDPVYGSAIVTNYPVEVENGKGTWVLEDMPLGSYEYEFVLNPLNTAGQSLGSSAQAKINFEIELGINISNAQAALDPDSEIEDTENDTATISAILTLDFITENLADEDVANWYVFVTEDVEDAATAVLEATLEEGTATAVISGITPGSHTYNVQLVAELEDQEQLVSNTETVTVSYLYTGIEGLNAAGLENGVYYNLQGVRVANPKNGIFILNGKKVVIR